MVDSEIKDILGLVNGFQAAKLVLVANNLHVFEAIENSPRSSLELAQVLDIDKRASEVLLNALTALGLLEKKGGIFSTTMVVKSFLLPKSPNSLTHIFSHYNHCWQSWSDLEFTIRKGRPKESEFLEGDFERIETFIRGMDDVASLIVEQVIARVGLDGVESILDLGGGPGTYAISFKEKRPELRVFLFDLSRTLKITRKMLSEKGKEGLIDIIEGDCSQDEMGGPYDMIWVSQLLHAQNEPWIQKVLLKAKKALYPKGKLVIHDFILDENKTSPLKAAMFSAHMLAVTPEGKAYSRKELSEFLAKAGFTGIRVEEHVSENTGLVFGYNS